MTETEERIAKCEEGADVALYGGEVGAAIFYELRALRLMLRDEIREAAWRMSPANRHWAPYDDSDPIASRKAPDA